MVTIFNNDETVTVQYPSKDGSHTVTREYGMQDLKAIGVLDNYLTDYPSLSTAVFLQQVLEINDPLMLGDDSKESNKPVETNN